MVVLLTHKPPLYQNPFRIVFTHCYVSLFPPPRMCLIIHLHQLIHTDMCIALRSGETCVAEHLLNRAQVCPPSSRCVANECRREWGVISHSPLRFLYLSTILWTLFLVVILLPYLLRKMGGFMNFLSIERLRGIS